MEAMPTQWMLRLSWGRCPRSGCCDAHGGDAHAVDAAVFMEAMPTQWMLRCSWRRCPRSSGSLHMFSTRRRRTANALYEEAANRIC